MPDLVPVDHDPFSTFVPVDHDPFAVNPNAALAASLTHYAPDPVAEDIGRRTRQVGQNLWNTWLGPAERLGRAATSGTLDVTDPETGVAGLQLAATVAGGRMPFARAGELGALGGKPITGRMAGVSYELMPEQFAKLKEARAAGAGREEIQRMVDEFSGKQLTSSAMTSSAIQGNLASRIEDAYNKLRAQKRYQYIDIADVKDALPDVPLSDLHAELKSNPRFQLYQNDNRATLTDRDRAAALMIGNDPRHKMFIDESKQRAGIGPASEPTPSIRLKPVDHDPFEGQ